MVSSLKKSTRAISWRIASDQRPGRAVDTLPADVGGGTRSRRGIFAMGMHP